MKALVVVLLFAAVFLPGCEEKTGRAGTREAPQESSNLLKDFVNKPKERAGGVRDLLQGAQEAERRELEKAAGD